VRDVAECRAQLAADMRAITGPMMEASKKRIAMYERLGTSATKTKWLVIKQDMG